jgi:hypothetical protein
VSRHGRFGTGDHSPNRLRILGKAERREVHQVAYTTTVTGLRNRSKIVL